MTAAEQPEPAATGSPTETPTVDEHTPSAVVPRPDTDIVQGEVVTTPDRRIPLLIGRRIPSIPTGWVVTRLPDKSRAKQIPRDFARVGYTIAQGGISYSRRAVSAATHGKHRELIRATAAAGDQEAHMKALEAHAKAKTERWKRIVEIPRLLASVGILAASVTALVALLLLVGGICVALTPGGAGWEDWWAGVWGILSILGAILTIAFNIAIWMGIPILLIAMWREGRRAAEPPTWLRTSDEADLDIVIDERAITQAIAALRMPAVRDYLKTGAPLQFLTPARVDGRGTHAVLRLPPGVTAGEIAKRRAQLATGLYRLAKEVWPTTGGEEGILDLWIADKGALAEGAGPCPLIETPKVDVFRGVPLGKTLRGDPVKAPLIGRNSIVGGMPEQGKSSAARVIMAGAALDPTAELRIWVPDANFDFEVFKPRCSRYVMGAEDERIEEILEDLRELHGEVQVRGKLLVDYEIPEVTRDYASKGVGLHPLFGLLEEAHVAIQHPQHGKEISKLLIDIVKLGRKRAIHMIVSTQSPTKDSMPRDVTRNCTLGIAFAVGDHVANDALLGQGAYAGGHRATALIPGTDRGTALVKGINGQRSQIVQVYFLSVDKTRPEGDQVTPIIERSLETIAKAGHGVLGTGVSRAELAEERDLLEDLDEVLGVDTLPSATVVRLLAGHAPNWLPYRGMTVAKLVQRLAEEGVKVPSTGNRWPLDPATVRAALARRATADLDEE